MSLTIKERRIAAEPRRPERLRKKMAHIHPGLACTKDCERMPTCSVCGLRKKPLGRDPGAAAANGYCDHECEGYTKGEWPGHLWPGELDDYGSRGVDSDTQRGQARRKPD